MKALSALLLLGWSATLLFAQELQVSLSSGRIESTAISGSCSAALLEQNLLITAAHCIRPDRQWYIFRPGDGDFPGETYALGKVIRHPKYEAEPRSLDRQRYDIALAWLTLPVPETRLKPISIGEAARFGEKLYIESWRRDGTPSPSQRECEVIDGIEFQVTLACEVLIGDSGAAVLRKTDRGSELVAIVTTRAKFDGRPVALATNADQHVSLLKSLAGTR